MGCSFNYLLKDLYFDKKGVIKHKLSSTKLQFELTPLAWKEMYRHDNKYSIKSRKEFLKYLKENEKSCEWINKINIQKDVVELYGNKIRNLLLGYALLDLSDWLRLFTYEKHKMWRLFEDLVYELFREILMKKNGIYIIRVDKWAGFKGLDYILINDKVGDWSIGIQCKRYVSTGISKSQLHKYGSYSKGTTTANLIKEAEKLKEIYPNKKIILITFEVSYENKQQYQRFLKLKNYWDKIIVFNKLQNPITEYKLNCNGLSDVLKWC